jgi:hypothetical protein
MDLGFALARTEYVVALDIDAFPISADWLDVTLAPVRSGAADVAGGGFCDAVTAPGSDGQLMAGYAGKPFVHPSLLAMRRSRFVLRRHSFRDQPPDWDTGERITRLEPRHTIIEPTSIRGPSVVGTVFGGVVYHNFYSTRVRKDARSTIDGITETEPAKAWEEALDRYLRPIPGFPL